MGDQERQVQEEFPGNHQPHVRAKRGVPPGSLLQEAGGKARTPRNHLHKSQFQLFFVILS